MSEETGRAWRANTVHTIATREDYKRSPTIVDPRIWNAAQRELSKRRKR
jgi:hypothetical protein